MGEIALLGLVKPEDDVLRRVYCGMKDSLVTHKPHKNSFACDAVIDGKIHIYDKSEKAEEIHDNLYLCHYNPPTKASGKKYPECSKEYVVQQHVTRVENFKALYEKLGIGKFVRHVYSVSDSDTSDSDTDDVNPGAYIFYDSDDGGF